MPLHASGKSTSKPAFPPGSSEGGGPGGGMKGTKGSAGTSMTPPGLAAGSEGRPVPTGDEDSIAAASVSAAPPGGAPGSRAQPQRTPQLGPHRHHPRRRKGWRGRLGRQGQRNRELHQRRKVLSRGRGPPGGTAECREGPSLGGATKRRHSAQRIHTSPRMVSKPRECEQKHRPRASSRASCSIFAHSPG